MITSESNSVFFSGRICDIPQTRNVPNGDIVCNATIVQNSKYINKNGETCEDQTFVELELWGKLADAFYRQIKKSDRLYVQGWLQTQKWDDGKKQKLRLRVVRFNKIAA